MNREPLLDNAKFLLIFLVVFGHVIQPFKSDLKSVEVLYHWIYLFHMPAFIVLSGFFAKGFLDKGYLKKLAKKLLLPYLIFHIFYTLYYLLIGVSGWQFTILIPRWSLWFLLSLFCWHILLTVFKRFPPFIGTVLAIGIGVIVGYIDQVGHTFSLSRTIVFFPFFLIGYWITHDSLIKLRTNKIRAFSLMTMSFVAIGIFLLPTFSSNWLLASHSYHAIGYPVLGGAIRLGIYSLSLVMSICFFSWIPSRQNMFTHIGKKTIYVYLLHGIFIHFFRQSNLIKIDTILDVIGLVIISLAIVMILSSKYIRTIAQPLIEAKASKLKQRFEEKANRNEPNPS
ncbi:acyltransferase family protein [Aquibacillus koreensis]|uniref:Acyltransferase family protein n=1 Tax=Aquibacillus koreensis TaxID=279446 RepID=A0A9X3WMF0_9BACI|nr:acyltransferase family protein [Aquibacillus koreensis]MCT2538180.1 acyltransferase family protein [Aquibacillus koreensis]MDC3420876.1 acyltransferase family protein [Aquibacillus koreensis]